METLTAAVALAELEAQPRLEPGTPGWWRVWGARVDDIRPGDIVMVKTANDEVETLFIEDTFPAKSIARYGIVVGGERSTLGRLCPIVLVRRGTHNTLSDSI